MPSPVAISAPRNVAQNSTATDGNEQQGVACCHRIPRTDVCPYGLELANALPGIFAEIADAGVEGGAPGWIRTSSPQFRRLVPYPIWPRVRWGADTTQKPGLGPMTAEPRRRAEFGPGRVELS